MGVAGCAWDTDWFGDEHARRDHRWLRRSGRGCPVPLPHRAGTQNGAHAAWRSDGLEPALEPGRVLLALGWAWLGWHFLAP
ncbi:MAG: DUF6186 family protein [Dermatophilaceae bacterium]